MISRILFLTLAAFSISSAEDTLWTTGEGDWSDAAKWSAGVPDAMKTAWIRGRSVVTATEAPQPALAGMLRVGTMPGDVARLLIQGGKLVSRRDFVQIGEAADSAGEIVLDAGALHAVSAVYIGGAGNRGTSTCRGALTVRGGSFLCRVLTLGWGQGSEAMFAVEGSRAEAVHVLDYLTLGQPMKDGAPSTSTLRFTLDAQGVTPVTIQSRSTGLSLVRTEPRNRCRLEIALAAVPPRGDVTLIAAQARAKGEFDDLPEGAEIRATHSGRVYRWTLTYRGGESGCDVVLQNARGHADDGPVTKCRAIPSVPRPLWETMPARPESAVADAPLAFEGAEGFGRHAAGGRGGRVIPVENLNDSGPGSFRAAVTAKGPRIVRFHVAGEIALHGDVSVREPFLTVDGSDAPAGGITLSGGGLIVNTHDVVLRHFRVRPGDATVDSDALNFHDATRCIADHLSLSWATDETLSITGLSDAITVQWCLISESLNRENHAYASIIGGERSTWHHNLLAHHISRVPRFAGIARADFRNNVLYNWGHTSAYGQFERVNFVGNYLKPGPTTRKNALLFHTGTEVVGAASFHLEGNVLEGSDAVTQDNWLGTGFERATRAAQPFPAPTVRTESAAAAYENVLRHSGALPERRDATDARIVRETRYVTGRVIDRVSDVLPMK